jgi:hypothetical protein
MGEDLIALPDIQQSQKTLANLPIDKNLIQNFYTKGLGIKTHLTSNRYKVEMFNDPNIFGILSVIKRYPHIPNPYYEYYLINTLMWRN